MVSNQRPSRRFLRLVWRGATKGAEPPSKGVVLPTDFRIRRTGSSSKHPEFEIEPELEPVASSSASTTSTGSTDSLPTGRMSSDKAVRFQLDEHQNVQCQVHVYESSRSAEVGGKEENENDDHADAAASAATTTWLSREELRRQKRVAIGEARAYGRDHPEYVRALELLFNSPVNSRPDVGSETSSVPTEFEALQVIGTCPMRGLEGYCTPALGRHKNWATQTILHVHGQLGHRRDHDGCAVSDKDGDTPFEADGESSMSSPSPLSIDKDDDEDSDDDDDDDENLRLLRRCCEFVNRGPGELAAKIGAADAWAAANVHRAKDPADDFISSIVEGAAPVRAAASKS